MMPVRTKWSLRPLVLLGYHDFFFWLSSDCVSTMRQKVASTGEV